MGLAQGTNVVPFGIGPTHSKLDGHATDLATVLISHLQRSRHRRIADYAIQDCGPPFRLGCIFEIHGLHRLLDRITAETPHLAASCSRLRGYVSRCEFELLLDHLTGSDNA